MTREEAIMELNQFSGTTQLKLSANFWTALNMAIKTLEQEPCEDCVSRQAILAGINDWWGITGEPSICDYIRELPPVTPTREKGKWIRHYCNNGNLHHIECSNCHDWHENFLEHKYCPNCGAEMEVEE